jgi:hypothetical protein
VTLLDAVLQYTQRGWRVFPLHGIVNGRCTCGRRGCSSPGKQPLVRRGLYEATTDEAWVGYWWSRWRRANIGLATGAESGIAVVDIDLPSAVTSLDRLVEGQYELPRTLTGLTGGGGVHLIYRSRDAELGNSVSRLPGIEEELPGVDLRANGGYVVAPPSVHRTGNRYEWLDEEVEPALAPEWLKQPKRRYLELEVVRPADFNGDGTPYGLAVLRDELNRLCAAQVGTRNHQLNRSAFAVAQIVAAGELSEGVARSALLTSARTIGLDEWESRQTINSGFAAGIRRPRRAPFRLR